MSNPKTCSEGLTPDLQSELLSGAVEGQQLQQLMFRSLPGQTVSVNLDKAGAELTATARQSRVHRSDRRGGVSLQGLLSACHKPGGLRLRGRVPSGSGGRAPQGGGRAASSGGSGRLLPASSSSGRLQVPLGPRRVAIPAPVCTWPRPVSASLHLPRGPWSLWAAPTLLSTASS